MVPTETPAEPKRERTDKAAVERDYRIGKFTLRELGVKYGINHSLIAKWVRVHGWTQDLTAAVKAATNAKLMQEAVTKAVNAGEQAVTDTVLAAAEINAQVVMRHRGWLVGLASDAIDARARLSVLAASAADIREAAEVIKGIESASRTLKTIIEGERKAHGIDDEAAAVNADYEELLAKVLGRA